jgi:glycosyltransferase involved in cell wall biosynthesis
MSKNTVNIVYDKLYTFGGGERVLGLLCKLKNINKIVLLNVKNYRFWSSFLGIKKFDTSFLGFIFFNRFIFILLYPLVIILMSIKISRSDINLYYTSSCGLFVRSKARKNILYLNYPSRGLYEPKKLINNKFLALTADFFISIFALRYLEKRQYRKFDKIYTISNVTKKKLKEYIGIDSEIILPPISNIITRKKGKINTKNPNFLIVSRLEPEKNIEFIFNYFNNSNENLNIVGTGSLYSVLKNKRINKNINFHGHISEKKLCDIYSNHDALIFPSDIEYSLSVLEALSAGIPVVAINSEFINTNIITSKNHDCGICYIDKNENSLRNAVDQFKSRTWSKKRIIEFSERFSMENFLKTFQKKLDDSIKS